MRFGKPSIRRTINIDNLNRVANYRPMAPIEYLRKWANDLLDTVGREHRCAVAGGAVMRALLGNIPHDCDFDLFVPTKSMGLVVGALINDGALESQKDSVSDPDHPVLEWRGKTIDMVECKDVADAIARFDIRACAVATDGEVLMSVAEALPDIRTRNLHVLRPTTRPRLYQYVRAGLDPRGMLADVDDVLSPDNIQSGKPHSWILPGEFSRDKCLGLDLDIELEFVDRRDW